MSLVGQVAIDSHTFFDNPTCHYLGKPADSKHTRN